MFYTQICAIINIQIQYSDKQRRHDRIYLQTNQINIFMPTYSYIHHIVLHKQVVSEKHCQDVLSKHQYLYNPKSNSIFLEAMFWKSVHFISTITPLFKTLLQIVFWNCLQNLWDFHVNSLNTGKIFLSFSKMIQMFESHLRFTEF